MRDLWIFINKYNAFLYFIIFFALSLGLTVQNNLFQRTRVFHAYMEITGRLHETISQLKCYVTLQETNNKLAAENAQLHNQLKAAYYGFSTEKKFIADSLGELQYIYIAARVVNNSIHQKNNYITINRGKLHGINEGMGVVSDEGIVGIVRYASDHYALVTSLLHSDSKISASVAGSNAFGTLTWGGSYDPQRATLLDVPHHIMIAPGSNVVTSGYSPLFPAGLSIGKVLYAKGTNSDGFLDIEVKLSTDFAKLQYVYAIRNLLADEQKDLEKQAEAVE